MIYFLCPDLPYPTGGVKQIHLLASYLQDSGQQVRVLYTGSKRPRIWFPSRVTLRLAPFWLQERTTWRQRMMASLRQTIRGKRKSVQQPRLTSNELPITAADLLVIPEIFASQLMELPSSIPKLILNQNSFLTFHGLTINSNGQDHSAVNSLLNTYYRSGVIGQLANSPYGETYQQWAFPGIPIRALELAVDVPTSVPELHDRDQLLVYFPRKSGDICEQVIGILRNRGKLDGWRVKPLENLSEDAVQQLFRQARLYIASSLQEGLGLPPLEAMANGCPVVGFPAWGGDAFLTDTVSRPVRTGDVLALAQTVEECLIELQANPSSWKTRVDKARDMVNRCHSHQRAATSCQAAFEAFLKQTPRA